MIEEEKQPLDTSNSTDDGNEVRLGEMSIGTSSSQGMGDLSAELDSELQFSAADQADEAFSVAESASTDVPHARDVTAQEASDAAGADDRTVVEDLRQEVTTLKAQLEAATSQCESFKIQSVRIAADFDNFRKRTAKEKEELEQQVKCTTLGELLPVVDNFERARSAIKPKSEAETNIQKSYQSVYKQLVECLKRLGVSPMRPEGREFDPNLHEAVMREATDEHQEGTVMEELVRGYFLGDRVLRHAMVKVAAAAESTAASSEEGNLETT